MVSLQVESGGDRFTVSVQAGSILEALRDTRESYPDSEVRLLFPISPADFFVRDGDLRSLIRYGSAEGMTG